MSGESLTEMSFFRVKWTFSEQSGMDLAQLARCYSNTDFENWSAETLIIGVVHCESVTKSVTCYQACYLKCYKNLFSKCLMVLRV